MHLTIEGSSAEEIRDKIASLAKVFGVAAVGPQIEIPLTDPTAAGADKAAGAEEADDEPAADDVEETSRIDMGVLKSKVAEDAPKKRGRKPKSEKTESTPEPVAPEQPAAEVPAGATQAPLTKQDCVDALTQVTSKKNLDAARELLTRFGAPRVSELKAEQYPAFIAECRAVAHG